MTRWQLSQAARTLRAGGIVAYPTEAVWGLGCDPENAGAVARLLDLKRRDPGKGLILIASDPGQLDPYLAPVDEAVRERVLASWPGPVTWLMPAAGDTPALVRGGHETLAVRVTDHPVAAALCRAFDGALVSTSANRAGGRPCRSALAVRMRFGEGVDYVLNGPLGGLSAPTEIRDARTGRVVRPGPAGRDAARQR